MRIFLAFLFLSVSLNALEPLPVTPYPVVGYKEIPFFDASQQKTRSLLIWYPVKPQTTGKESPNEWDQFKIATNAPINSPKGKMPVVVFSHGYGGTPHQLSWLINKFIYNNYIVLAVQHSDFHERKTSCQSLEKGSGYTHALIDLFSSNAMSFFADLNRIGIAGFSLGGTTAIWLAGGRTTKSSKIAPSPKYASQKEFSAIDQVLPSLDRKKMSQNWKDSRIKSAFLMAPAWAWIFDEQSLKEISIPTFISCLRRKTGCS